MKDGQLECYGTIPSLKKKYDQGFTVMLKLRPVLSVVVNSNQEDDDSLASQSRPLSVNNTCNSAFVNDSEEVKKLMFVFGEMYKGSSLRDKHSVSETCSCLFFMFNNCLFLGIIALPY